MDSRQLTLWGATAAGELALPTRAPSPSCTRVREAVLVGNELTESLMRLDSDARRYLERARAGRTRLAYSRDVSAFMHWCSEMGLTGLPAVRIGSMNALWVSNTLAGKVTYRAFCEPRSLRRPLPLPP
jgi:hypothetical protein